MNDEILNLMKDDEAIIFIVRRYRLSPDELLHQFFSDGNALSLEPNEQQLLKDFYEYLNKPNYK